MFLKAYLYTSQLSHTIVILAYENQFQAKIFAEFLPTSDIFMHVFTQSRASRSKSHATDFVMQMVFIRCLHANHAIYY